MTVNAVSLIFLHQKSHTESVQTLLPLYGEDQQEQEEEGLVKIMHSHIHLKTIQDLATFVFWVWPLAFNISYITHLHKEK